MRLLLVTAAALTILVVAAPSKASEHSYRALAWKVSQQVFGSHAQTAFCIAGYESHYNPYAVSPTDDHGEWQIHRGLEMYGRRIYNIWFNAHVAYRMSRGGTSWGAWTTHRYCGV